MSPRALSACVALLSLGGSAVAAADAPAAPPAKVAVVVAGDPDDAVRTPAARLDALLAAHPKLRTPADPGLRRALRGEAPSDAEDGLDRARAERRRLGWGEGRDVEVLARVGRMAGADLLLVVRLGAGGAETVGFDVRAGAFYEGALPLADLDADALHAFALPRARAAAESKRAQAAPPPPPTRPAGDATAGDAPAGDATAAAPPPEPAGDGIDERAMPDDEKEDASEKPWIGRNWPYLVAGALLAASIVFMVVRDSDDDPGPPVLRFRLGSDR